MYYWTRASCASSPKRSSLEVDGQGARITEPKAGSRRAVKLPTPAALAKERIDRATGGV